MANKQELVSTHEIAIMAGVSGAAVSNWIARKPDGFPEPIADLRTGKIFDREHVYFWLVKTGRLKLSVEKIVERMAEHAHNAWWQTYVDLGYTSRKAAWGEEFMVPFDELSEQGKEFDRMIMRAILKAFEEMNLKLVPA